jgi:hypothetical protein
MKGKVNFQDATSPKRHFSLLRKMENASEIFGKGMLALFETFDNAIIQ